MQYKAGSEEISVNVWLCRTCANNFRALLLSFFIREVVLIAPVFLTVFCHWWMKGTEKVKEAGAQQYWFS